MENKPHHIMRMSCHVLMVAMLFSHLLILARRESFHEIRNGLERLGLVVVVVVVSIAGLRLAPPPCDDARPRAVGWVPEL